MKNLIRVAARYALPVAILALGTSCRGSDVGSDSDQAVTPGIDAPVGPARTCNATRISGDGIGELRIGLIVDSVRAACNVTGDTTVMGVEGMPGRIVSVAMDTDTVFAEIVDDRVWRILVRSQGLFTSDSLSVGSSVASLVELPELQPMTGEGYLYARTPAHCGMSFRLSVPPSTLPRGEWTLADLRNLPPTVHVTRILLFGCSERQ